MRHFLGLPTSYMGLLLLMCPTSLAKAIKLKKKGRAQALCVRSIKKAWADALAYSKFESVCSWSTTCTSGRLRPTWTNCQYCSRELCGKLFTIMRMMPSNHCCEHSYFGKKKCWWESVHTEWGRTINVCFHFSRALHSAELWHCSKIVSKAQQADAWCAQQK